MRARTRRLGLVAVAAILLVGAAGLAFVALRSNANLFYTPTDLAERGGPEDGLAGKVGGFVEVDSIVFSEGSTFMFTVIDDAHSIKVEYDGIAPDLFREGAGVVAEGVFNAEGTFEASRLLAKHDENYVPRELVGVEGPQS